MAGKTLRVNIDVNRNDTLVNVNDTIKVVLARGSSIEMNATKIKTGMYEASIEIPKSMNRTYSLYSVIAKITEYSITIQRYQGSKSGGYVEIFHIQKRKSTCNK
jgi:hypothetical protein